MKRKDFSFLNKKGIPLSSRICSPEIPSDKGVIFSHGLFSTKDGYKITGMTEDIVSCGYHLMTFDFSYAGESHSNIKEISFMQEVADLRAAIDEFKKHGIKRLHLMGSSMGAAVSLYVASEFDDFESLILIATPVNLLEIIPEMTPDDVDKLDPEGSSKLSGIEINNKFFKELKSVDLVKAARSISKPAILFHGKLDSVVPFVNHSILLNNLAGEVASYVIDDGDHNLTRQEDIAFIMNHIREWLRRFDD